MEEPNCDHYSPNGVWPDYEAFKAEYFPKERELLNKMNEALKKYCADWYERERCREAYYKLILAHQDRIGQRYGIRPMQWKKQYETSQQQ